MSKTVLTGLLLVALLTLSCYSTASQNPAIDSLKQGLANADTDSMQTVFCNELAWEYAYTSPDSGLYYAQGAKKIARHRQDQYNLAIAHGMEGINLDMLGRHDKAMHAYLASLDIWKELGDITQQSVILNNIAIIYTQREEYNKSLPYMQQVLKLDRQMGNKLNEAGSLVNIGIIYHNLQKNDTAIQYYERALALQRDIQDSPHLSSTYISLGNACLDLGQLDQAEKHFNTSLELDAGKGNLHNTATVTGNLAYIAMRKNKPAEALALATRALELSEETMTARDRLEALEVLAYACEAIGNYERAYHTYVRRAVLKDSLNDIHTSQQIHEIENRYKVAEKEQQIALLNTENQLQESRITQQAKSTHYLIVLAVLGACCSLFGFGLFRTKQRYAHTLHRKNDVIRQALQEKEVLLKEIHHRVKNNLQIVSSLLFLQAQHVSSPTARTAINEGRNRVRSMALLHQRLYQGEGLTSINIRAYTDSLVASLQSCYSSELENVIIDTEVANTELDVDMTIPLGLIINELVTNAIKHAFGPGDQGHIRIHFARQDTNYRLQVCDTGRGLPTGFDPENSQSFGLNLVKSLAKKLRAITGIQSRQGTEISIY
ncbi:MAG: tetratricopeptide repeat protein, partial [Cyclobacteriaceae bacterium]